MKRSQIILIVMGAFIAVIGVTALAGPMIADMVRGGGRDDGRISIVVATPAVLDGVIAAAEAQQQADQPAQQTPAQPADGVQRTATSTSDAQGSGGQPVPQQQTNAANNEAMMAARALQNSSFDGLGNEIASRLLRSRRFDVKDTSQFMGALRDIGARAAGNGEQTSIFERLRFWENSGRRAKSDAQGGQTETETREGGMTREVMQGFSEADFRGAGRALNADYVLVVAIRPTDYRHVHVTDPYAPAGSYHHENHWAPTIIYRVFEVDTGNVVLADETTVSPEVVVREGGRNESEIVAEMLQQLNDRVGTMLTRRLMDTLAPARIVSTDETITINRGSNDGVREGQIYEVEREQLGGVQDVRYDPQTGESRSGPTLETRRERVGQLRILTVQGNIATAAQVEGTLARGDIVVITPSSSRAISVSNTGGAQGGEVPLGEGQAVQPGARASLAVGEFDVSLLEPVTWRYPPEPRVQLSRNIAGHLAQSGQVTILSRGDLDRLRAERALMARSQGIEDADVDLGVATSGNLLNGEVRISGTQAGESISVGGQSRQTRTAWRLIATGAVRVQTTDGRTLYSVPVRTERPGTPSDSTAVSALIDAFSADAAAALLQQLYPIRVSAGAGNTLVLDRGPEMGLRQGTRLAVFAINPQTRTRQRLGEIVVTDAAAGYSATARYAAAPFTLPGGDVRAEIISGGAPPRRRTENAPSQTQEPQPAPVQW